MAIGGAVLVAALLLVHGVLPAAGRWSAREAAIAAERSRVERLRSLGTHRERIVAEARAAAAAADSLPVRLLQGRTPALAASALQALLQEYAAASRVSVSRLDVAGAPDSTGSAGVAIPASISAVSDIYGLADFLTRIEHGHHLLTVAELSVTRSAALAGELLQLSMVVRAPVLVTPSAPAAP